MDARYFHAFVVTVGLILGLGLGVAPTYTTESEVYAQGNTKEVSGSAVDENVTNQQVQEPSDAGSKKDKIEPTIVSRSPNVNTVSIPVNTNIEVKFSEPVKNSSLSSSTFILKTSADEKEIPGLVLLDSDKTTATFTPTSALFPLQSYTVTLTSGIKDLAGNRLKSEEWSFTTEGNPSASDGASSTTTGASDLENKTAPGGGVGILNETAQNEEDSKLLDRLLPLLYQKIDINTIIEKADGKKLLEKVLPYLDVNVTTRVQKSGIKVLDIGYTGTGSRVKCSQDELLISGGYLTRGIAPDRGEAIPIASVPDKDHNQWEVIYYFGSAGEHQAYALCMKVKVGILIPGKSGNLGILTKPGGGILKGLGP
jgi:Bacterial Ig-like domain